METLGPFKGIYRLILGLCRDNGKENGNYRDYECLGFRGLCWGYIGVMEKKMETLGPFKGIYRLILGVM